MHKIVVFLLFLCGTLTAGTISSIPVLDMGDFENPQTRSPNADFSGCLGMNY